MKKMVSVAIAILIAFSGLVGIKSDLVVNAQDPQVGWLLDKPVSLYDATSNPNGWYEADNTTGARISSALKFHNNNTFFGDCHNTTVCAGTIDFGQDGFTKVGTSINCGIGEGVVNGWGLYINVLINGTMQNIGFVTLVGSADWEITFKDCEANLNTLGKSLRGQQNVYLYGYGNQHVKAVRFSWDMNKPVSLYNAVSNPNGWYQANGTTGERIDSALKFHNNNIFFGDCHETAACVGTIDFGQDGFNKVGAGINCGIGEGVVNGWGLYINVWLNGTMQNIGFVTLVGSADWEITFKNCSANLNALGKSLRGPQKIYIYGYGNQHVKNIRFGNIFPPPDESFGHQPVTVYADEDFKGVAQEFGLGDHNYAELTASAGIGNDTISGLRVAPGYKVTLFANANFSGSSIQLTSDDNLLTTFNDKTSSLRVEAVNPVDSTCIQINSYDNITKETILKTFAPRIWMASGETYWSSSVEWALPNLTRYYNTTEGKYCYTTTTPLGTPTTKLPFFSGNQASAVIYSFWTEKDYQNIDLSYWQYSPYNYGKVVLGQEFGNHVGDWEHITVRLTKFKYQGNFYLKPVMVCFPAHDFSNMYQWSEVTKINNTHVVAYSAKGSHGMWKDAGSHVYKDIVVAQLTDECSTGTAWDTWNTIKTFEYSALTRKGNAVGASVWPSYFNEDYTNPNSQCAWHWGNEENGSAFGQPILGKGPYGVEIHKVVTDYVALD